MVPQFPYTLQSFRRKAPASARAPKNWSQLESSIDSLAKSFLDLKKKDGSKTPPKEKMFDVTEKFKLSAVEKALAENNWNQSQAAKILGIPRLTLLLIMKRHRIPTLRSPARTRKFRSKNAMR
jgi:transcriptional regulator with GAF, ATPase, and Fis domain